MKILNKTRYRKIIAKPLQMGKNCKTSKDDIFTVLLSSSPFFTKETV
jgi:hypothetical protein